ncbi:threonine ammonia-lyase [Natronospira bacteriovora]|uniref:Threonine/serine dehydratase n=1 Tax=Natronospira bacteriovora TaxID=3069753 RepID=A0ABU0W361_9GAMM|nr:threonine/serine dehydratase [Natronospira sp. AB-CW4]MDQ2068414.1 threonine/serine dehydratase [Natronospira sp. AB-CW4]
MAKTDITAWPDRKSVESAADRIRDHVESTPLRHFSALDASVGQRVFLKCENLQAGGAFKARGACNAVFSLSPAAARRGVATHSSGNHAAALARAAHLRGIPAHVVMPEGAARPKQEAARRWGARIIECQPTMASRVATLEAVVADTGATVIHPYEDGRVMAGQGTVAMEILAQLGDLGPGDTLVAPVGGGGLISGMSAYLAEACPGARIVGVEPEGADDTIRSLAAGRIVPVQPSTIADGLRATVGTSNLAIIRKHVHAVVSVSDDAIIGAMKLLLRHSGMVLEPSGVVAVAALMQGRVEAGERVVAVLTGGNVDRTAFDFLPPPD